MPSAGHVKTHAGKSGVVVWRKRASDSKARKECLPDRAAGLSLSRVGDVTVQEVCRHRAGICCSMTINITVTFSAAAGL